MRFDPDPEKSQIMRSNNHCMGMHACEDGVYDSNSTSCNQCLDDACIALDHYTSKDDI